MKRVRVKICGITRNEDAVVAANLGADAIGLVFHAASPRAVDIEQAVEITRYLPPFVSKVGLFVDADEDYIREVLDGVSLDMLQFHGKESAAQCRRYDRPYIKAISMKGTLDPAGLSHEYRDAAALLFDTYVEGIAGGSGRTFDWDLVPAGLEKPVILAGGLNTANICEAIARVRPYAVDVSGGVERDKGIKSAEKIQAFIREVNNAKG